MDGLFDLLASLLVVQSRIPLAAFAMRAHCWLVVGLLFPWTNKVVLRRAAFQMVGPQCVLVRGVIPPQGHRSWHFPSLNIMGSLCPRPSERQHNHTVYQLLL